ncbi:MAG: alkaline phosphatase family protein [Kofleriaceae bacterium]
MPPVTNHVIVLMMENRSFDHMFGYLTHTDPEFPKLKGTEFCLDKADAQVVVSKTARYEIASPDHSHAGIMQQLMGANQSLPYQCNNGGFVRNYEDYREGKGAHIMRCFDEDMIPVLTLLAREYAVCTRWHASVPGETWPNREFAHSGTSRGNADIKTASSLFLSQKTIFQQLEEANASWRIYHDDTPHTWNYVDLWGPPGKRAWFKSIDKLHADIKNNNLPSYSFIEPDYGISGKGNSQHPGQAHTRDEFVAGERLIHEIYTSLRGNQDVFDRTIFVITYDEHGGFFDRAAPPTTVNPDGKKWKDTFNFDLLGVRVPAVIVSPWIKKHTVDHTLYDHTSIIATVRDLFAPGLPHLTQRDKQAKGFSHLLRLAAPRRGADLPPTYPLSEAKAAQLEAALGPIEESVGGGEESIPIRSSFENAMQALSDAVGNKLAAESGEESVEGPQDPKAVLARFRASATP